LTLEIRKAYTAFFADDLPSAEAWYTKLFGRGPDSRPTKRFVLWQLFPEYGLALTDDSEIAGNGAILLRVDDLDAERSRLLELGIVLGENIESDFSILAQVFDPYGNLVTVGTMPKKAYPSA
jgi:predicted enzyme related to lactoylglutathione lyase